MHTSVMQYVMEQLTPERVAGRRVLEVGSYNVNGSVRYHVESLGRASYIGVDQLPQDRFVDVVCSASALVEKFGASAFDLIICCEMLEHCEQWREAIYAMKGVLAPRGLFLLTVRGPGFPRHEFPVDCWRFTAPMVQAIFSDFCILDIREDAVPGVLMLAERQVAYWQTDLSEIMAEPAPN